MNPQVAELVLLQVAYGKAVFSEESEDVEFRITHRMRYSDWVENKRPSKIKVTLEFS